MLRIKSKPPEGEGINMTPMIDVVFQLLIFFMLCTDMSTKEQVDLTLPRVSEAIPDEGEPGRQTISIDKKGHIHVGAYDLTAMYGKGKDLQVLSEEVLRVEAQLAAREKDSGASRKPILIRADNDAQFGIIQEIMVKCVKYKIYRLSFATKIGADEASLKGGS